MFWEIVHNDVFKNFHLEYFCFKKTNRVLLMMTLDQLYKHAVRKFHELLMTLKIYLDLKLKIVRAIKKIPQVLLVNSTGT